MVFSSCACPWIQRNLGSEFTQNLHSDHEPQVQEWQVMQNPLLQSGRLCLFSLAILTPFHNEPMNLKMYFLVQWGWAVIVFSPQEPCKEVSRTLCLQRSFPFSPCLSPCHKSYMGYSQGCMENDIYQLIPTRQERLPAGVPISSQVYTHHGPFHRISGSLILFLTSV